MGGEFALMLSEKVTADALEVSKFGIGRLRGGLRGRGRFSFLDSGRCFHAGSTFPTSHSTSIGIDKPFLVMRGVRARTATVSAIRIARRSGPLRRWQKGIRHHRRDRA